MTQQEKRPGGKAGPRRQQRNRACLSTSDYRRQQAPRQVFHNWVAEGGPAAWAAFDSTHELLRELDSAGLVTRDDPRTDCALRRALTRLSDG